MINKIFLKHKKIHICVMVWAMVLSCMGCMNNARHLSAEKEASVKAEIAQRVILGNERLFDEYFDLIRSKRIGIVTNQTGINFGKELTWRKLAESSGTRLAAIYAPEHGLDGQTPAGEYISSYVLKGFDIPVYSLYGETRMPTEAMLSGIEVILFDVQDIGSRAYTYISTLNYVMKACAPRKIPVIVLDRPNPLGDRVDGFVLSPELASFVGIDELPLAHGMTIGELALFFNRKIGAQLKVIPMLNYRREMVFHETGLPWVATSPNIPDLESAFCYMATGLSDGTGVYMGDCFKWFSVRDIQDYSGIVRSLNDTGLEGVVFAESALDGVPGVRLLVTDYKKFLPCSTAVCILGITQKITGNKAPVRGATLFEKLWGTYRMTELYNGFTDPSAIRQSWAKETEKFIIERKPYLIY
jgi:uncharacterized protein YbbC (DUF1343 family)